VLRLRCYSGKAISERNFNSPFPKAQTTSSFLTPGKTLTHATAPRHNPTPYHYTFIVIQTTEGRKDLGNTHLRSLLFFVLIQRKGNKRKIKCYGSVAIRVKPLVNGTSTRLLQRLKQQVPFSLLAKPSLTQLLLGTTPTVPFYL